MAIRDEVDAVERRWVRRSVEKVTQLVEVILEKKRNNSLMNSLEMKIVMREDVPDIRFGLSALTLDFHPFINERNEKPSRI